MAKMDRLRESVGYDDDAIEFLADSTGYDGLLTAWRQMAGHAAAAADEMSTVGSASDWYEQLTEQRHARFAAEMA